MQFLEGVPGDRDGGQAQLRGTSGGRVHVVDEAVDHHGVEGAGRVRREQVVHHQQDGLGQYVAVGRPPLGRRPGDVLVLVGRVHVAHRLGRRHDVVAGQFPVQYELAGRRVEGGVDPAREAFRPAGGGVQRGGEVLHHRVGVAAAQARQQFPDRGVVAPDLRQLTGGPLVVLPPVVLQLTQALRLRGLCGVPVVLVADPGLFLRLRAAGAAEAPAGGLRLVGGRVGHRYGYGEPAGRERLDVLGAPQRVGGERRGPAAVGQQAGQLGHPRVQFLGAAAGVGLALLPVRVPAFALHPGHGAFGVALLPLLIAAGLFTGPPLRLLAALLLTLRLGPDGH